MLPRKPNKPVLDVVVGPNVDVVNGVDEDEAVSTVVDEAVIRGDTVNAKTVMINVSFANFNNPKFIVFRYLPM